MGSPFVSEIFKAPPIDGTHFRFKSRMARSTSSNSSASSIFDLLLPFLPVDGCSVDCFVATGGSAVSSAALPAAFFFFFLLFFFLAGY